MVFEGCPGLFRCHTRVNDGRTISVGSVENVNPTLESLTFREGYLFPIVSSVMEEGGERGRRLTSPVRYRIGKHK